jgi:hypothetical protein
MDAGTFDVARRSGAHIHHREAGQSELPGQQLSLTFFNMNFLQDMDSNVCQENPCRYRCFLKSPFRFFITAIVLSTFKPIGPNCQSRKIKK